MADVWEKVSSEQRMSELLELIREQKKKEQNHRDRENAQEKKYFDKIFTLTEMIEALGKHILELEKRVAKLEEKKQ